MSCVYPDDLNPFGTDDGGESEINRSVPQESHAEENVEAFKVVEKPKITPRKSKPAGKCVQGYDNTLNPFADQEEGDLDNEEEEAIDKVSSLPSKSNHHRASSNGGGDTSGDDDTPKFPTPKQLDKLVSSSSSNSSSPIPSPGQRRKTDHEPSKSGTYVNSPAKTKRKEKRHAPPPPPKPVIPQIGKIKGGKFASFDNLSLSDIQEELTKLSIELDEVEAYRAECYNKAKEQSSKFYLAETQKMLNKKQDILSKKDQLMQLRHHRILEEEHHNISAELRLLMNKDESFKTGTDRTREEELLSRMVDVISKRDKLLDEEEDRFCNEGPKHDGKKKSKEKKNFFSKTPKLKLKSGHSR